MYNDPIVSETRQARDAYAASFEYDLTRIVADIQARQGTDGRKVVSRPIKAKPLRYVSADQPVASAKESSAGV